MQNSSVQFELHPIAAPNLPEVAHFLSRWQTSEKNTPRALPGPGINAGSMEGIQHRLDWLLLRNDIQADSQGNYGFCVRDGAGTIRGIDLSFPVTFASRTERCVARCSSSFLVEHSARSMGFYLFKKVLSVPHYRFHFASTCNSDSGELWKCMGGQAVPQSETEFIVPLQLERLMERRAAQITSCRAVARFAAMFGRSANPILRSFTRRRSSWKTKLCSDWEKLSTLFQRHQMHGHLSADRSPATLEWRYGSRSPLRLGSVFVFRDECGNEGWFSFHPLLRGPNGELRCCMLLDLVWPRDRMAFLDVLRAVVNSLPRDTDALAFRAKPGLDLRSIQYPGIFRSRLPSPRAFVKTSGGAQTIPLHLLDCDDSDFIAWTF